MSVLDILRCIDVILDQNLEKERLLKFFIYPKFEQYASQINIYVYIKMINTLADLKYEVSDLIFCFIQYF